MLPPSLPLRTSNLFNQLRWSWAERGRRSSLTRRGAQPAGGPSSPLPPPQPILCPGTCPHVGQPPQRGQHRAACPPSMGFRAGRAVSGARAWRRREKPQWLSAMAEAGLACVSDESHGGAEEVKHHRDRGGLWGAPTRTGSTCLSCYMAA